MKEPQEVSYVPSAEVLKAHFEYMGKLMALGYATGRGDRKEVKDILEGIAEPKEWGK